MAKQPEGQTPPKDGSLPPNAFEQFSSTPFSFYVHVPFCANRCGYCDFNTYTSQELGGGSREAWSNAAVAEIEFAGNLLPQKNEISTVFIGGGTPTLLPAQDIASVIHALDDSFGLSADTEVTIEANPDSVSLEQLRQLREVGVNRISFGMQSAVPHVLKVLERTHNPESVAKAVSLARDAGFDNVNLDLIYGTPGESVEDLRRSLEEVAALNVEHVSAYALIVEEGTSLARRIKQGDVALPDDDDMAEKYEVIDSFLSRLGMQWYELSNWSKANRECQHNLHYWQSHNWWGVGPGAHSHIGGVRWWNAKHPTTWSEKIKAGETPAVGREILSASEIDFEKLLLEIRLADGFEVAETMSDVLRELENENLIVRKSDARAVLTLRGRLLADAVVRRLTN